MNIYLVKNLPDTYNSYTVKVKEKDEFKQGDKYKVWLEMFKVLKVLQLNQKNG